MGKEIKDINAVEVNGMIVMVRQVGYASVIEVYRLGREVERKYVRGDSRKHTDELALNEFHRYTQLFSRLDNDDLQAFINPAE